MVSVLSCSIHYHRIHPVYWKDRLQRVQAMGLNTIEVRLSLLSQHAAMALAVANYCDPCKSACQGRPASESASGSPKCQMQIMVLSMVMLWMPHNIPSAASISLGHTLEYPLSSTSFPSPSGLSMGWTILMLASFRSSGMMQQHLSRVPSSFLCCVHHPVVSLSILMSSHAIGQMRLTAASSFACLEGMS